MATMDIFEGDAFSIIELTRALENIPCKPATLSGSGIFGARGVRVEAAASADARPSAQLSDKAARSELGDDPMFPPRPSRKGTAPAASASSSSRC